MKCLQPIQLRNPKYETRPWQPLYMMVPCGKCVNCLKKRRQQWCFRLEQQARASPYSYFVTLTYNDDLLPPTGVNKTDVQLFMKRFRKRMNLSLKYFLCSEYGDQTHRPHYHALFFSDREINQVDLATAWNLGFISISPVNTARINYCAKYFVSPQSNIPPGANKNFSLISRGIGLDYLTPSMVGYFNDHNTQPYIVTYDGFKVSIPRYYKDHLLKDSNVQLKLTPLPADNAADAAFEELSPREYVAKFNFDIELLNKNFYNKLNNKHSQL